MPLEFKPATRAAFPMPIAICGPSGSGKTFSAILLAAGIAGPNGKVALLDTENGRGVLYADSPAIRAALPQGYLYAELEAPFSPERYVAAIDDAEKVGINVLVIDSGSHEWEGYGGCCEISERDNGRWNKAKRENRKYIYRILYSNMAIILCLRAREKVKIIGKKDSPSGKEEIIPLGMVPICERNTMFEMLLSVMLDEKTHAAIPVKVPDALKHLFPGDRLITKEQGEQVREWNQTGAIVDPIERLKKQARATAEDGMDAYKAFFGALTAPQRAALKSEHEANKQIAEEADRNSIPEVEALPDPVPLTIGTLVRFNGTVMAVKESEQGYVWVETAA